MEWEKRKESEIALCLCHVITVHTKELEKRRQPAPEHGWKRHGETLSHDSHFTPITKAQENTVLSCGAKSVCVCFPL